MENPILNTELSKFISKMNINRLEIPTTKQEEWRFTNLSFLKNKTFNSNNKSILKPLNNNLKSDNKNQIYIVNNCIQNDLQEFNVIEGLDILNMNSALKKYPQIFNDYFSTYDPQEALALSQFNQIALTGFDMGNYSVSGGLYYPIIAIQGNNIFRELLSDESKPVASIKYTTERTETQLTFSLMRLKSSHQSETNMKLIRAEEMVNEVNITQQSTDLKNQMESFDLNSQFLRINYAYKIRKSAK